MCSARNPAHFSVTVSMALPLRCNGSTVTEGHTMLMFKRSQLYVGLGLAAVVEIIIRVVVH
jgi:hypothetical protein